MDKRWFSRLLLPLAVLVVAVFWLLKVIPATTDVFDWYTLSWAATILLGVAGLKFLLDGIFMHSKGVIARRLTIIAGAVILVLALICLTSAIAIPDNLVAPIIAIILAAALVLGILVTGARQWDAGDNQRVGYKNYYQRKAEEDKAEKKDHKN
ncbi:MAG: hypothetical protein NC133_02310 [Prevotella sp.]|nr:hypothetical protein [Prevotella sp.]